MVKSLKPFTGFHNPYLSISAPPNSYTMDLMEVKSYHLRDEDKPIRSKRVTLLENVHTEGNKYILVLIETTSRKLFAYALKEKSSEEVLKAFMKFLEDTCYRVNNVTSDSGTEFSKIWSDKKVKKEGIKFYKVVAEDGYHTPLAMVDRVIRTLRMMIYTYFSEYQQYDWHKALPDLVDIYNNTKHSSLFIPKKKKRYTPNQVWMSPYIAKQINVKDRKRGKKGEKFMKTKMKIGESYNYIIDGDSFSKNGRKGFISNDVVQLKKKVGNQFEVISDNPKLNGKLIPYQKLIPIPKTRGRLATRVERMKIEKEERKVKKHIKPSALREEMRLMRNNLFDKKDKKGWNKLVLDHRLRSEAKKKRGKLSRELEELTHSAFYYRNDPKGKTKNIVKEKISYKETKSRKKK